MAKIVSDAGEITLEIKSFARQGGELVVAGTMGVWQAKVFLSPGEAVRFVSMALSSFPVLLLLAGYPLAVLRRRLGRMKGAPAKSES